MHPLEIFLHDLTQKVAFLDIAIFHENVDSVLILNKLLSSEQRKQFTHAHGVKG
jgi:Zn-dependent peptidase ImmA (M78 family)